VTADTVEDAADAADVARGAGAPDEDVEATMAASLALLGTVVRSLGRALEQVTLPQYRALVVLAEHGPLRSGDLAVHLGVHQSTMTRTVDRLVAGGWVGRAPSPSSRREVLVSLSAQGRALVTQALAQRRREVAEVLSRTDDHGRRAIRTGFEAFAAAAGEPDPGELLTLGL